MVCPLSVASAYANVDGWRGEGEYRTCNYCGSLHPDVFMEDARNGIELTPTDKDYKVYVKKGPGGVMKFYFEHLSTEQKQEFVDLYNARKIKLGYPGHFYNLPFFMGKA